MRSTYDRSGGNEGADASHFLFQLRDNFNVVLDVQGPGLLVFSRFNRWHGSPWHFLIDGNDHVIEETDTKDPTHPRPNSTFIPAQPFPAPLNWTWSTAEGSDLIGTPMPFARSLKIAYSRTQYGTGYFICDRFVPGTGLSRPIDTWNGKHRDRTSSSLLLARARTLRPTRGCVRKSGDVSLARGSVVLAKLKGKREIRALKISIPQSETEAFEHVRLQITWDHRKGASVDAPIALFFGAGTLYNRTHREFLVKAFPVNIRFDNNRIYLSCYFPMPFFHSARIELTGAGAAVSDIEWSLRTTPLSEPANLLPYFHATYHDFPHPQLCQDLVLLDTRGTERVGNWSGQLVGTSFMFSYATNLTTLEGDPRFFFDDSLTPQVQGTGTEEWGGGGDYWDGGIDTTLPFYGHPVGARSIATARDDEDKIESAYRFLLADAMPFGKNAVIRLEHGGTDESSQHYESVVYWYGLPAASLIQTDELDVTNARSERKHDYYSPQASRPYAITSRYEWGVDAINGEQIYPAETDYGRVTTGTSEFRLRIRPDNLGVLLRRNLDYAYPNQRAEVSVADQPSGPWKLASIWYLAGSNRSVYSNPPGESDPDQHRVEISNRRFRDDEFLVARNLTQQGRKFIWVRIHFTPVNRPLYSGYPVGKQAWSEMRYRAYCFVIPKRK